MQIIPTEFKGRARDLAGRALNVVLPPRCVVTGDAVERQGMVTADAWAALQFISDPFCEMCGFPFEFEVEKGSLCTGCLSRPPPFEMARSALKYNDASRDMILGFKHADKTHNVRAFVPWLTRAGAEMLAQADVIVPVPLHRRRLLLRRYNQAALIAGALSRESGVAHIPDCMTRVRATKSQGHLRAKERHINVKRAFAVSERHADAVRGKAVVLIDDVYTTGATVKECAKALLKAGAGRVFVLTLARVVRDEF